MAGGDKGEFAIITKAKDLVKHTDLMTSEKRFPKKYRFTLVNRIQNKVIDIFEMVSEANELDLNIPAERDERHGLQRRVLTYCKTVLFFIEYAFEKGLITESQAAAWSKMVFDVKYITASWYKRDRERGRSQH
jgi:hypothetical protein